jgi:2-methylisocitrate lyase-like PEP mutase family enzyme
MFEGGGKTPWVAPDELHRMGFSMILYPTTLLFQAVKALEGALKTLKSGRPMPASRGVDLDRYEQVVDLAGWSRVEESFPIR